MSLPSFFRTRPQRLCVLGVWLHFFGLGANLYFLVAGSWWWGVAGIAMAVSAGAVKVLGRDLFKADRVGRHMQPAPGQVPAATVHSTGDAVRLG